MAGAAPDHDAREHGVHGHGHGHGLVDPSIKRPAPGFARWTSRWRSSASPRAQVAIYVATGSVAPLADLIHNLGDAATAFPLGIAFALRSERAERIAGH